MVGTSTVPPGPTVVPSEKTEMPGMRSRSSSAPASTTRSFWPNEDFQSAVYDNPFRGYTFEELLGYAQASEPLFVPGTSWSYSHTDYAVLVEVLEAASGQDIDDLLAERIFGPLGMDHSSAYQDATIDAPALRAFTEERGVFEESTTWDSTWGMNAGMNASVGDIGRWLQALDDGELLDDEAAELALSPEGTAGLGQLTEERYFAFGSLVSGDWILGSASLNGYRGFTGRHRGSDVTVVVYATPAAGNPGDGNAAATLGQQIAAVLTDDPIVLSSS